MEHDMRERRVLIADAPAPRRRAVLAQPEQLGLGLEEVTLRVPTDVAAVLSGQTDAAIAEILEQGAADMWPRSPWFLAALYAPARAGWWNLRGPGPFPTAFSGRVYFQLDEGIAGGGMWTDGPDATHGTPHADLLPGHEWQGLARRYRAQEHGKAWL